MKELGSIIFVDWNIFNLFNFIDFARMRRTENNSFLYKKTEVNASVFLSIAFCVFVRESVSDKARKDILPALLRY